MLVNATEMLIKARDGHYGVPQFNINTLNLIKRLMLKDNLICPYLSDYFWNCQRKIGRAHV